MPSIPNNSSIVRLRPITSNMPLLDKKSDNKVFNNRNEAIDYIKTLTHDRYSPHFNTKNTIGELKDRINIPLNTLELGNGKKQSYVTANMDPRKFIYLDKGAVHNWDISMLNIQDYHDHQVVFIFGANFTSDTLPVNMKMATEKIEEIDGVHYVYCDPFIKFTLHTSRLSNDEIMQKSDLINSFKLDPQRKEKLIELLENCSSRNMYCSNNDAIELCKEFPNFFENTDEITPDMQINTFKLANELAKEH